MRERDPETDLSREPVMSESKADDSAEALAALVERLFSGALDRPQRVGRFVDEAPENPE
jgi:hypothetical protein